MSDEELVEQLKRVQSDLTFRKRTRRRVIWITVLVVVNVVVSVVAVVALIMVRNQQNEADADRADRARGSCVQFNINQHNTREAIVNGLVDTFRPLVQPGDEQELADFAASLRVNVEKQLPYRRCTDEAIEAFLKNPPQDPNTGG